MDAARVSTFNQPGTETWSETGSKILAVEETIFDFLLLTGSEVLSIAGFFLLLTVFVGDWACLGFLLFFRGTTDSACVSGAEVVGSYKENKMYLMELSKDIFGFTNMTNVFVLRTISIPKSSFFTSLFLHLIYKL